MQGNAPDQEYEGPHGKCLAEIERLRGVIQTHGQQIPVPMLLWCPSCGDRHIDAGEFAVKVHHTHACQGCGMVWRPAVVATIGVSFLPGFKNRE